MCKNVSKNIVKKFGRLVAFEISWLLPITGREIVAMLALLLAI